MLVGCSIMTSILLNSAFMGSQSSLVDAGSSSANCASTGSATAAIEVFAQSFTFQRFRNRNSFRHGHGGTYRWLIRLPFRLDSLFVFPLGFLVGTELHSKITLRIVHKLLLICDQQMFYMFTFSVSNFRQSAARCKVMQVS